MLNQSAFLIDPAQSPKRRLLALGDSYTIGEGVPSAQSWPFLLVDWLARNGHVFDQPDVVAKTGWTARDLSRAIQEHDDLLSHYDLVTLMIGVNNQYRGEAVYNYERELSALVRTAVRFAGMRTQRVLMISIPHWNLTPFARQETRSPDVLRSQVASYNEMASLVADSFGVPFIDLSALSKLQNHGNYLTKDLLHPSGSAYAEWVEVFGPAALSALRPSQIAPSQIPADSIG